MGIVVAFWLIGIVIPLLIEAAAVWITACIIAGRMMRAEIVERRLDESTRRSGGEWCKIIGQKRW